jgi:hypothetical protein
MGPIAAILTVLLSMAPSPKALTVDVFQNQAIGWVKDAPSHTDPDGYVTRFEGQTIQRRLDLPPAPQDQRDAQRIVVRVHVEPLGQPFPHDPWNRLGSVSVLVPEDGDRPAAEVELIRFVTGFGAQGVFEQDVTALAPLLHGPTTLRAFVSTYSEEPGWRISVSLVYDTNEPGYRRPVFAWPLFKNEHVTSEAPRLRARVVIAEGLSRPRLRIISTGHATDGIGGDEFITRTHILRIDGREVARWRPWAEAGAGLRNANPWAGRHDIDGRALWNSDLDRSGWHPGEAVEPLLIPVPELSPGPHVIELEILDIRPKGKQGTGAQAHGYWVVTGSVVADEPWPDQQ